MRIFNQLFTQYPALMLTGMFAISLFLHFDVFQKELCGVHLWRQAETQIVVRNFAREDANILNPRTDNRGTGTGIKRVEFPLMQWLMGATYRVTGGDTPLNSRIFTFIIGVCTVLGIYALVMGLTGNPVTAGISAWTFNFSPVFFYYTVNPLPDNFALSAAVWSLALFLRYQKTEKTAWLLLSALLFCIGALVKLPFVLVLAGPVVALLHRAFSNARSSWKAALGALLVYAIALGPVFAWYSWVIPTWTDRTGIVQGILGSDAPPFSEVVRIVSSTLVSLLPELLLNYASTGLFVAGIVFFFVKKIYKRAAFLWLSALLMAFLAYYFFEIHLIDTVHDYYLFPFLPLLFIVTGFGATALVELRRPFWTGFVLLCLAVAPLTAYLRIHTRWHPDTLGPHLPLVQHRSEIQRIIPPDARVIMGADVSTYIMPYLINRKGWVIPHAPLSPAYFEQIKAEGAGYLLSNDRALESDLGVGEKLVFEKDGVRVYRW